MKKPDVTKLFRDVKNAASKHSPEILMGMGITAGIATTVLAVKATPKAFQLIEEKKKEENKDELTPVETVQAAWKLYVPAAVTGVFSVACLLGSGSVNAKRNAAIATAYKLSETAFTEYKEKVVETIGEKKEKEVRDKVAEKKVKDNPIKSDVIIAGTGTTLCMDAISGRCFYSDMEKIRKSINELNARMLVEMYISLNEFYSELGLDQTTLGDDLGWNINDTGLIDLDFSSQITADGRPCLVIDYRIAPRYDYSKLM